MAPFWSLYTTTVFSVSLTSFAAKSPDTKTSVHVLSEEPRIEYHSNFISASDASALRKLATGLGFDAGGEASASLDANGGNEICILNRTAVLSESIEEEDAELSHEGWAAAGRFEAAAAEWAKLPIDSSATVISRWESWIPGFNRSGLLHLDARLRPFHQRTILAYLSGSKRSKNSKSDSEEGYTVFPCLETDDMDAKELKRRQKLCSRAFRHVRHLHDKLLKTHSKGLELDGSKQLDYLKEHPELTVLPKVNDAGVRPVDWQWTAANDAVAESPGAVRADPLFALADAMCHGKAPGLRIRPEVGAAVLFETAAKARDGTFLPDWQMWHAGCSPGDSHSYRWTAQLFLDGADARLSQGQLALGQQCSEGNGRSGKECKA